MTDDRGQMIERIESFRELKVYRAAFELQQEIFEVTGSLMVRDLSSVFLSSVFCHPSSVFCRPSSVKTFQKERR